MGKRAVISRRACGELPQRALLGPTRITAYSPEFYEAWHEHISITEKTMWQRSPGGGGGSGGMVAHDLVNGWQAAA